MFPFDDVIMDNKKTSAMPAIFGGQLWNRWFGLKLGTNGLVKQKNFTKIATMKTIKLAKCIKN